MSSYPKTLISVMPYLKEYQILYHVDEIIENEESTALVLILSKNRFFGDFITVNRISRTNYHINYSNYHRRARTAKETAQILKFIIYQIKFNYKENLSK